MRRLSACSWMWAHQPITGLTPNVGVNSSAAGRGSPSPRRSRPPADDVRARSRRPRVWLGWHGSIRYRFRPVGDSAPEAAGGATAANADHLARSAAQIADALADARLAIGISGRAAAASAGIGRNTQLRLERDPAASRVDLVIRLGLVAGLRSELRPFHASGDVTRRAAPPLPDGAAAFAGAASASALGAHLARLLGAELRWTRRAARRTAVDVARDAGLGSDRTVRRLEHGEPTTLGHALAVALCLGHRLVWEPAKSPWRQRPWQLPQPSPSRRGRRSVHPMFSSAFSGWTSPPELVTSLETLRGPWGASTSQRPPRRAWRDPGSGPGILSGRAVTLSPTSGRTGAGSPTTVTPGCG